jgi:uncharacterized membrane protein
MSVDPLTLTAILVMAVITYLTRIVGYALIRRLRVGYRLRTALEAVPGAVLVALVAPAILAHGFAEALAGAVTILAALQLPVIAVVVTGVAGAALFRHLLD